MPYLYDSMSKQQTTNRQSGTEAAITISETPSDPDMSDTGVSVSESEGNQFTLCGSMSAIDPTVSVVIPTLNEEQAIEEVLQAVFTALRELGLPSEIVVADSSTDSTPDIARDHGAIVTEPERKGYGAAYLDGFDTARGDIIAMGDADTTYDFTELPKLIQTMQETDADMVIGSRLNGQILSGAMPPLHQYVGNPMLTRMLNTLFDAEFSDTHSGFRVFTAEALDAMNPQTTGMEFASEMLIRAAREDLSVEEVPITYHPRVGEAKLESFRDGWRHIRYMLGEWSSTVSPVQAYL
jgi:glycosyltransferase involved in cell wall biosynthesis